MTDAQEDSCIFCHEAIQSRIVFEYQSVVAIDDRFPVTPGHLLVLPRRHCTDYFQMTMAEKEDADHLLGVIAREMAARDSTITGFNIGTNIGRSAGQTIFHCHIHLIPRRDGDTPSPRGGVRGVIPCRMNY